jgi:hypothetical protein
MHIAGVDHRGGKQRRESDEKFELPDRANE